MNNRKLFSKMALIRKNNSYNIEIKKNEKLLNVREHRKRLKYATNTN